MTIGIDINGKTPTPPKEFKLDASRKRLFTDAIKAGDSAAISRVLSTIGTHEEQNAFLNIANQFFQSKFSGLSGEIFKKGRLSIGQQQSFYAYKRAGAMVAPYLGTGFGDPFSSNISSLMMSQGIPFKSTKQAVDPFINAKINQAATAAMKGDTKELLKIEDILNKIHDDTSKEISLMESGEISMSAAPYARMEALKTRRDRIANAELVGQYFSPEGPPPETPSGGGGGMFGKGGFFAGGVMGIAQRLAKNPAIAAVIGTYLAAKIAGHALVGASNVGGWLSGSQQGILGESAAYFDPLVSMSKVGLYSNGRFSGKNALDTMLSIRPKWMTESGMGPSDYAKALEAYGLPIGSNLESAKFGMSLSRARLMAGMGGMPFETYAGMLSQAGVLGISDRSGTANDAILDKYQKMFIVGTREGLNQSDVLKAIQGSMQVLASAGPAGISSDSALALMSRLMSSGIPYLRGGEGATDAMAKLTESVGSFASDPLKTMLAMKGIFKKTGGSLIETPEQLRDIFPKAFAAHQNEAGKDLMNRILISGQEHQSLAQMLYLQEFLKGSPDEFRNLINPEIEDRFGPVWSGLVKGNLLGWGVTSEIGADVGAAKERREKITKETKERWRRGRKPSDAALMKRTDLTADMRKFGVWDGESTRDYLASGWTSQNVPSGYYRTVSTAEINKTISAQTEAGTLATTITGTVGVFNGLNKVSTELKEAFADLINFIGDQTPKHGNEAIYGNAKKINRPGMRTPN